MWVTFAVSVHVLVTLTSVFYQTTTVYATNKEIMNLLLNALWVLCLSGSSFAQCPLNAPWVEVGNKCMVCGPSLRYAQAKTACERLGGRLASILTPAEETFAEGCSSGLSAIGVWFGLVMRNAPPLKYGWLDGSPEEEGPSLGSGIGTAPAAIGSNCYKISDVASTVIWDPDTSCLTTLANYVCSHEKVQCQPLTEPADSTSITYSPLTTPYYPGHVATYTCNAGYELDGEGADRTCEDDGDWSGREPVCDPVGCGLLLSPINGRLLTISVRTYSTVVTYYCNAGYTLGDNVEPSRVCQADKTWSGSALTCSPIDCGPPPPLVNGAVSAPDTTYGAVATYTCDEGYVIGVTTTRTCVGSASGYWSANQPSCGDGDNTTATVVGVSAGALAFIGLTAALMYLLCRRTPSTPALLRPTAAVPRIPAYPLPMRPGLGPLRPAGPRPRLY